MAGTSSDKLALLQSTKAALKAALIEKGQTVSDTDPFSSYPSKVLAISGQDNVYTEIVKEMSGYQRDNGYFKIPLQRTPKEIRSVVGFVSGNNDQNEHQYIVFGYPFSDGMWGAKNGTSFISVSQGYINRYGAAFQCTESGVEVDIISLPLTNRPATLSTTIFTVVYV